MIVDLDIAIGWHDVDDTRRQRLGRRDGAHGERPTPRKDVGEVAWPFRVDVLGNDDGGDEVAG